MKKLLLLLSIICIGQIQGQIITTVAGIGTIGYSGDGGQAVAAQLYAPFSIAFDTIGNMYIADENNNCIRKVNTSGIISTFAGNGTFGFSGDGGLATSAKMGQSVGVAIDAVGNIYISDNDNQRIRMVNASGIITTVVGSGAAGYSGDGGQALNAKLNSPSKVAFDKIGNMYFADEFNFVVRKVDTSGIITTVAGNGSTGFSGDGGSATMAQLANPSNIAIDTLGNLYITDAVNNRIRMVTTSGIISSIAGTGTLGYSGDGGLATNAELNHPYGISLDSKGIIYIADYENNCIRKINNSGIITTVAGNGSAGFSGDGGLATSAKLNYPTGVAFDKIGNIYIADNVNNCIRKIDTCLITVANFTLSQVSPHNWDAIPSYSSNITNAKWYWGDGTSTTGLYPSHTYSTAGWYNLCVTVYSFCGDSSSFCQNDSVYRTSSNNNLAYINVINNTTTAINSSIGNGNDLNIYPNPTNNQFFIDANSTDKLNVDLYDVNGRHVFSASVSDKSNINVATLDNGIYTLTIKTADRIINKKLVILH